jgi:hypothetical protein
MKAQGMPQWSVGEFNAEPLKLKAHLEAWRAFPVIGLIVAGVVADVFQMPTVGSLLDPIGLIVIGMLSRAWTPVEKNTI